MVAITAAGEQQNGDANEQVDQPGAGKVRQSFSPALRVSLHTVTIESGRVTGRIGVITADPHGLNRTRTLEGELLQRSGEQFECPNIAHLNTHVSFTLNRQSGQNCAKMTGLSCINHFPAWRNPFADTVSPDRQRGADIGNP